MAKATGPLDLMYQNLHGIIDPGLSTNLFQFTGDLIFHITPIFLLCAAIYLVFLWQQYYNQGMDQIALDYGKKLIFWLILAAITLNGRNYIHLANLFFHAPEQISQWFTSRNTNLNASFFDIGGKNIQILSDKISDYYDSLNWWDMGELLKGTMMYYAVSFLGWGFLTIAFSLYGVAKICLAITLMVGPIFLAFLFFPVTRQWFMNWIGQVLNFIMSIVFYLITTLIFVNYLNQFTNKFLSANVVLKDLSNLDTFVIQLFVAFILFVIVLFKLPSIASALTGGASIEGAISGAVRAIAMVKSGGMSTFRTLNNPNRPNNGNRPNQFRNNTMKPGN